MRPQCQVCVQATRFRPAHGHRQDMRAAQLSWAELRLFWTHPHVPTATATVPTSLAPPEAFLCFPGSASSLSPRQAVVGPKGTLGYAPDPTRTLQGVCLCSPSHQHQDRLKTSVLRSPKLAWDPVIFLLGTQLSGWGMIFCWGPRQCQSSGRSPWISLLLLTGWTFGPFMRPKLGQHCELSFQSTVLA